MALVFAVLASGGTSAEDGWAALGQAFERSIEGDQSERDERIYRERLEQNAEIYAAALAQQNAERNAQAVSELRTAWISLGVEPQEADAMVFGFEIQPTAIATRSIVERNGWRWGVQKALEFRGNLDVQKANETLFVALNLYLRERASPAHGQAPAPEGLEGTQGSAIEGQAEAATKVASAYSCVLSGAATDAGSGMSAYPVTCPSGARSVECISTDAGHECWLR